MPVQLAIVIALLALAAVALAVGILMAKRGTGTRRRIGGWIAVVSGVVVMSFSVVVGMALLGGAMDDVPGLW